MPAFADDDIEQLFRTGKSQGLDLESSQVEAAEALFNLAAIAMIAATKIMQLVLARDGTVDRPATDVVAADQLPMLDALQIKFEEKPPSKRTRMPDIRSPGSPGS